MINYLGPNGADVTSVDSSNSILPVFLRQSLRMTRQIKWNQGDKHSLEVMHHGIQMTPSENGKS